MRITFLKTRLVCAALLSGVLQAAPLEGFVVISNNDVSTNKLSPTALKGIYTGKTMYWESGQRVVIVVMAGKTDSAFNEVSGMDASEFKTFWQRLAFSGRGQLPKKVDDAASLVALVASTKGAIALVPASTDLKGVQRIDVN